MICTKDMYIFIYGWPSICGISCFFKNVPGSFQGEGAHHWNQHGWHDRAGELENPPVLRWENPDFPIPKWLVLGFKKANHVWCFRRINAYKCDKWTHGVMVRPPFFVVKIWLMGVSGQNRDDLTMFLDIPGERERERERYFDIPWYTQTSISSTYPNIYKKSLLIYIIYVLSIYSEHVTSIPWIQELAIAVPQRVASLALLATYSSALYALPTTAALVDLARSMGLLTRDLREQGLEDGGFLGIEHDGKLGV